MAAGLYRLHHTRLKPSYLALNIGPIDAVPRHAGRRTRPCCCTHLLSSRIDGSENSLVRRDHEEVCPLSRGVMLQPVSRPLQPAIRFFPVPAYAPPWADLAACCPRAIRGFHVPLMEVRRVRCQLWAGRYMLHESVVDKRCSHLHY